MNSNEGSIYGLAREVCRYGKVINTKILIANSGLVKSKRDAWLKILKSNDEVSKEVCMGIG